MRLIIYVFVILYLHTGLAIQVDTTLVKFIELTGDSSPEKVELHIQSSDFNRPFIWTLTIKSNDDVIYSFTENDSSSEYGILLEVELGEKYEKAKTKFYFEDFVGSIVSNEINFGGGLNSLLSETYEGSIHYIAKNYLIKNFNLSPSQAKVIIENQIEKIKSGKAIYFMHRWKGIYTTLPMMYFEEIKKLVPIYSS